VRFKSRFYFSITKFQFPGGRRRHKVCWRTGNTSGRVYYNGVRYSLYV